MRHLSTTNVVMTE